MNRSKISVVIPIYKKADMVLRNLKHNREYLKNHEVILVDDASGEDLAKRMNEAFPEATILVNEQNRGFAPTVNRGVKATHGEFVILLGSDVKLMKDFADSITQEFDKDPNLFAITFKQKEKDGKAIGKNRIYFRKGLPNHEKTADIDSGANAWADGGASIVRSAYFKDLGGFNELYAPFYWEDNDLSYRAYSRGWHVIFDPSIFVEHHHESTIGTYFDKKRITTIAYRNQFIFTWTNITDPHLWREHLKYLPYYLVTFGLKGDRTLVYGFCKALKMLPSIYRCRMEKKRFEKVSDSAIFGMFAK